jgi:hypothetical protein
MSFLLYRLQVQADGHARSMIEAVVALEAECASQAFHALAHSGQAEMVLPINCLVDVKAGALVRDFDLNPACLTPGADRLTRASGMPEGVVQGFLDDTVESDLYR